MKLEAELRGEELPKKEKLHEFSFHLSNSSCNLNDIQGIIYGGFSSRFWIYRKHMISLDYDVMKFDS